MKKFLAYSVTLAMAFSVNFAMPQSAQATAGQHGSTACQYLVRNQIPIAILGGATFSSVGDCNSFGQQFYHGSHYQCSILEDSGNLEAAGYKNFGDCVSDN